MLLYWLPTGSTRLLSCVNCEQGCGLLCMQGAWFIAGSCMQGAWFIAGGLFLEVERWFLHYLHDYFCPKTFSGNTGEQVDFNSEPFF